MPPHTKQVTPALPGKAYTCKTVQERALRAHVKGYCCVGFLSHGSKAP
ncbi:MAG: hypothetical protein H8D67_21100 [Deltaproteobacteria bacterium]|nr:hypothetical protein [Deltaproteobacteria bacterium]